MDKQNVKFQFDVSTFRLIGRELITDNITAIVELVKNGYDANANEVFVEFYDIDDLNKAKIIIRDDGLGMSITDIKEKWMVIGTNNKRTSRFSPPPYNRPLIGKKGIGRFAVDKLGGCIQIESCKIDSPTKVCLINDWKKFEQEEQEERKIVLFTDIENELWEEEKRTPDEHGTKLTITAIHEVWIDKDIKKLYTELSRLIIPDASKRLSFSIILNVSNSNEYNNKKIESFAYSNDISHNFELNYDSQSQKQDSLALDTDNNIIIQKTEPPACGPVHLLLHYYDKDGKALFKKSYPHNEIDGIKIYRDGLLTTPCIDSVEKEASQKDIFGLDKRRYSGFFDKISSRDLIGKIFITDKDNPDIIDTTNRQGFIANQAWQALQDFVIHQITVIEESIKKQKENELKEINQELDGTGTIIKGLKNILNSAIKNKDYSKIPFVITQLSKINTNINKNKQTINKMKKEAEQQKELMFSLVTLQMYSGMFSHIVKTMLGKMKRRFEFIHHWLPKREHIDECIKYSGELFKETENMTRAVEFLLKYSKDGETVEDVNIVEVIEILINQIYAEKLKQHIIDVQLISQNKNIIIRYNKKAFEDIIDNLLSNSIKSMSSMKSDKKIKISISENKNELEILYSNNGPIIPKDKQEQIFDVFYTTTAHLGGAGLGLYIIKTRLQALHGNIQVIDSEFKPTGASFKITIPFRKRGK